MKIKQKKIEIKEKIKINFLFKKNLSSNFFKMEKKELIFNKY